MGPRSDERGNVVNAGIAAKRWPVTSMGPRSDERGNAKLHGHTPCNRGDKLQWGRAPMSAEIDRF